MSNNQDQAQKIADKHDNDAYSVALAMIEREGKVKADAVIKAADWLHNNYAHKVGSAASHLYDFVHQMEDDA